MSVFEITNISKRYGHKIVLNNVSISGKSGDCIGIVGANGCGKSTLIKILSGTLKPDSGSSTISLNNTGYVPQDNPLFDNLTVLDNLKLSYCDSTHNLKEDIRSGLIHSFDLEKYLHYTVSKLSGGLKKRLSIVCAISKDPDILLLDEPGASLDIVCKNDICNYMHSFCNNGGIVIIASHEEGELSVCNKRYIIQDGHLAELSADVNLSSVISRIGAAND